MQAYEDHADYLVARAKITDDVSLEAALYTMARMHRVRVLQLRGMIAALRIQHKIS